MCTAKDNETNWYVCGLENDSWYMSGREFLANAHLNLSDELCAQLDARCHLQEQHNPFVTAVSAFLSHTEAVLHLLETFHYTHNVRMYQPSVLTVRVEPQLFVQPTK